MASRRLRDSKYRLGIIGTALCLAAIVIFCIVSREWALNGVTIDSERAIDNETMGRQNHHATNSSELENDADSIEGVKILDDLRRRDKESKATQSTPWNEVQKKKLTDLIVRTENTGTPKVILDTALPALNYFDLTDKATEYPNSTRVSELWSEGRFDLLENMAWKRLQADKLDLVAHVIFLELALKNKDIDSAISSMENILDRLDKRKPSLSTVAPSLIMIIRLRADRLLSITSNVWNTPIESKNEFYRLGNCPIEPYLIYLERSGYFENFE